MERVAGFDTDESTLWPLDVDNHRWCRKLAVHPTREVVYVLAANGITARVRAYDFAGTLMEGTDHSIDWCGVENINDYKLALDSSGTLLLALSDKIYPFNVALDGSLDALYVGEGISWQTDDNATLHGKTDILFAQNKDLVYINSAGPHLGGINLAGGSVCLNRAAILAEAENPFVYPLTDFMDDLLPWIVRQLGHETIGDIIKDSQLYGISASAMVDNTCLLGWFSMSQRGTVSLGNHPRALGVAGIKKKASLPIQLPF